MSSPNTERFEGEESTDLGAEVADLVERMQEGDEQ